MGHTPAVLGDVGDAGTLRAGRGAASGGGPAFNGAGIPATTHEVLLGTAVWDLVGSGAGAGEVWAYRERGHVYLQGLSEPVRVLEALPTGVVRAEPPPPLRGVLPAHPLLEPPADEARQRREAGGRSVHCCGSQRCTC
jgi:hypothetical protein